MVLTKKKKSSKSNILFIILEVICILIFFYAAIQLYMIFSDYKTASNEYETLAESFLRTNTAERSFTKEATYKVSKYITCPSTNQYNP